MMKIKELFRWLLIDTFPFSLVPLFLLIHMSALYLYQDDIQVINKLVSDILQFIGLIVVLKAVNDNMRIIDRSSLIRSFTEWLNVFPLRKRNITVKVNTASMVVTAGNVKARVIRNPKTVDERINYAFEEIVRLERDIDNLEENFKKEINNLKTTLGEIKTNQENNIKEVQTRLSEVFAGGAKEELFGIVCIFYSLVTSFFS